MIPASPGMKWEGGTWQDGHDRRTWCLWCGKRWKPSGDVLAPAQHGWMGNPIKHFPAIHVRLREDRPVMTCSVALVDTHTRVEQVANQIQALK